MTKMPKCYLERSFLTSARFAGRGQPATLTALDEPRLAPQPFAHQPLGDLSTVLHSTASELSRPFCADRRASVSLVPPLVLIYALPAEIQRRRRPRRRSAAPRAVGGRGVGDLRHPWVAEHAAPAQPRALPCPVAALDAKVVLLLARAGGRAALSALPFASPQVNTGTQIDGRRGRHA